MFNAAGAPNGGIVVIAYGSDGMTDDLNGPWAAMIREYAGELSRKGFRLNNSRLLCQNWY